MIIAEKALAYVHWIDSDRESGMHQATKLLIGLNHTWRFKRIYLVRMFSGDSGIHRCVQASMTP